MNASEKSFSLTRASSLNRRLDVRVLLLAFCASSLLSALSQTNPPAVDPPTNAVTGPTIRLDFGRDQSPGNPVASFMYFVPLISPEPVSSVTSPGSTQVARVLSAKRTSTPNSFVVTCEFEFAGNGSQQSIFDLAPTIRRQEQKLKAGGSTGRLLNTITVGGPGSGTVEVEGTISNNVETVSEVRLRFNSHGKTSPIAIELCEIRYQEGEFRHLNEIIARVNTLTFNRKSGRPKMEVKVASVKNKRAGEGLWENFKGSVMGLAVNLFIPPLTVEAVGHQAMLDFGRALASGAKTFTFPRAPHSDFTRAALSTGGRAKKQIPISPVSSVLVRRTLRGAFLGLEFGTSESILPVWAGRFGRTPHIALSGAFLALRASHCNGWPRRWVSGQRRDWDPGRTCRIPA